MKKYLSFVIALVMIITAVIGTSTTAFAATDPNFIVREANSTADGKAITVADYFTTGTLNGPTGSGWLNLTSVEVNGDLAVGHIGPTQAGYGVSWTLSDGVLIIRNTFPEWNGVQKYAGVHHRQAVKSPFGDNPYIETVIFVGGPLFSINFSGAYNLKNVIIVDGSKETITADYAGKKYTYSEVYFAVPEMLPSSVERIVGNISCKDGLPMVSWDRALGYTGRLYRTNDYDTSYAAGWFNLDANGNPTVWANPYTAAEMQAVHPEVATAVKATALGGATYTDANAYKAYVQSVINSIKLNDEARTLLAGYGYDTGSKAPAAQTGFKVSDWAKESANRAFDMGIGNNYSVKDCTVPITRKQFAILAIDTVMRTGGKLPAGGLSPFTDVDDSAVTMAYQLGIVNGYGGGKFGPDDLITREQAATMLANLANASGKPMTAKPAPFTDRISSWAADGVAKCYGAGIMSGVGGNLFDASGNYTIEQSLVTMVRIADYLAN